MWNFILDNTPCRCGDVIVPAGVKSYMFEGRIHERQDSGLMCEARKSKAEQELIEENQLLSRLLHFNKRVFDLASTKTPFVVVAQDEPYFREVYNLIRSHEQSLGRWDAKDEELFCALTEPDLVNLVEEQKIYHDNFVIACKYCEQSVSTNADPSEWKIKHKPDCRWLLAEQRLERIERKYVHPTLITP